MRLIYYSKTSVFPALLAAVRHSYPKLSLDQGLKRSAAWWEENQPEHNSALLEQYAEAEDGTAVYVATASAEPSLVERTLTGLYSLCSLQESDALLIVSSLPVYQQKWNGAPDEVTRSREELSSIWREVGVAVKEARLQNMLQQVRP